MSSPHEMRLRRAFREGCEAHPDVALARDAFEPALLAMARRRLERAGHAVTDEALGRALGEMPAADAFLAIACEQGAAGAWEELLELHVARLRGLARHLGATPDEADEIARSLPGDLCCPPPDGSARTRIGAYDGSGSLGGWLGIIVSRRVFDRPRPRREPLSVDDPETPPSAMPAATGASPDGALLADESARLAGAALRSGWSSLTANEGLALLLRFRDGLAQKQVAAILGVGEPRVSRIIGAATDKLRRALSSALPSGAGRGGEDETWRALCETLARQLATPGDETDLPVRRSK